MADHKFWSCGPILLEDLFILFNKYFVKIQWKSLGWVQGTWFPTVRTAPHCNTLIALATSWASKGVTLALGLPLSCADLV